ncbi:MAG: hypothetical protein COB38_00605 [Gammaproteobacteria bacterium]|nr:MAG: hypothetical protein COB38_00605 [Gammaproteobacteria bacterium]
MGEKVGPCESDCEAVDSGTYNGEYPLRTDTTITTPLGDGSTLVTQIIPQSCGSGKICITRTQEGDVQYMRTYKDGFGLPAVFDAKGKGIPWLDIASLLIESELGRYYVEHSIVEIIKQKVDVRNTFYDSSGNFSNSKLSKGIYRPIAKQRRILRTEFMGVVRSLNRKQPYLSRSDYLEEKNHD